MDGTLRFLALLAVLGAIIGVAELADPEAGRWLRPPRRQLAIDAAWVAAHVLFVPWLGWLIAKGAEGIDEHNPLTERMASVPFVARALLYALTAELVAYAVHRSMHAVSWLWRLHSVHHSSTHLHWWSAYRFHPLETVIMRIFPAGVGLALGLGLDAVAPYTLVAIVVTLYSHADLYIPGRWVHRVVCTPSYHRTHHETGRERSNYALVLPLFDLAFGTADFRIPAFAAGETRVFGSRVTPTPAPAPATQCWPSLP